MRSTEPIPWVYSDNGGLLAWVWTTPHFVVRIIGNRVPGDDDGALFVRQHHWEIADRMAMHADVPKVIVEGNTRTFAEAEILVREHVGKAYPGLADYAAYIGSAAACYELETGEVLDVAHLVGSRVTLRVRIGTDSYRALTGEFQVAGYWWRITTTEGVFEVLPAHVVHVAPLPSAGASSAWPQREGTHSGVGRIYAENPRPGCTGRAGYAPNSVDHAGAPRCPVHESEIRDHLIGL